MKRFANWITVLLLLAWITAMPVRVCAEEVAGSPPSQSQTEQGTPSQEGGAESAPDPAPAPDPGANDVSLNVPDKPQEGTVTITEHIVNGEAQNDVPIVVEPDEQPQQSESGSEGGSEAENGGNTTETDPSAAGGTANGTTNGTTNGTPSGTNGTTENGQTDPAAEPQPLAPVVQKAIDQALDLVVGGTPGVDANSESVTISLTDGTYTGDLSINGAGKVHENFTLILKAEDADVSNGDTTTHTNSAGNVIIDGNIDIQGIRVMLYGIYVSLEKKITISDSVAEIAGTQADDTYSITTTDSELKVDGGEGDDTIELSANSGQNKATITGGSGNDSLSLNHNGGTLEAAIDGGGGADTLALKAGAGANSEGSSHTISGGSGDDTVTVDTSFANASARLNLQGGDGTDTLNLAGALSENDTNAITGTFSQLVLKNNTGKTIELIPNGFESFTDTLTNKTTVKLESLADAEIAPFVNYIYEAGDEILNADWTAEDALLTNLLITGDTIRLGSLNIPSVNLTAQGKTIEVSGNITAASILLKAYDSDTLYQLDSSSVASKVANTVSSDLTDETGGLSGSLFDFTSNAKIAVKNGTLNSTKGSIIMSAIVEQTRGLIDILGTLDDGINFLNVKVGSAIIELLGATLSSFGSILADASTKLSMTVTNEALASVCMPLAVAVGVTESAVRFDDTQVNASGDLRMSAKSEAKAEAEAAKKEAAK